ncbi:MAG: hypothetical protein RIT37_1518, partial [Bacteroidota bacterium]
VPRFVVPLLTMRTVTPISVSFDNESLMIPEIVEVS